MPGTNLSAEGARLLQQSSLGCRGCHGPWTLLQFSLLHLAVGLGLFLVWLFVIMKASKGEWYKLPLIGDFADKQARS
jgi:hypothetical protein